MFYFSASTDVYFGNGIINQLKTFSHNYGRKTLIVTDRGVDSAGILEKITEKLTEASIDFAIYSNVEPNPSVETVTEIVHEYNKQNCDFLIGLGGGSVLDAAKASAILTTNEGRIYDFVGLDKVKNPPAKLIAIPTTAGTGSEVTSFSVITDKKKKFKMSINSKQAIPALALCDPELTVTKPPGLTAETAMDAFCHALESYISKIENPIANSLTLKAIGLIGSNLRLAVADGENIEARYNLMLASMLAGIAIPLTRTTVVHAMGHPLSAHFDISHGIANAVLLPHGMRYNLIGCLSKYSVIAESLGENIKGLSLRESAIKAIDSVELLSEDIRMPNKLSVLGVQKEKFGLLAEDAMKSGNITSNPRSVNISDVIQLYENAY